MRDDVRDVRRARLILCVGTSALNLSHIVMVQMVVEMFQL
jgi:hypothetical protein